MERIRATCGVAGLLFAIAILPANSRGQSGAPRPPSPSPFPSASPPSPSGRSSSRSMDQTTGPVYIGGRILTEVGKPPAESVSVELVCGMRTMQVIHSDLGGYFTFSLGSGAQSNVDFSASDEVPLGAGGGSGSTLAGTGASSLTGCEVRVSVPGYHPLSFNLSEHADMGRIEVGTLQLRRIEGVEGSAISATSLLVPKDARKEFDKGDKEFRSNRPDAAKPHLEKAVAAYDKFAAAWNELGQVYLSSHDVDKAREAFQKAIAADRQYTPPYMSLASLELQSKHFESAVATAGKLLELDQSYSDASFIEAVGNFNLNRLDAAEKSALEAAKGSPQDPSQVHALLAEILLQKQDYKRASAQMREYLAEAPAGQFAQQMRTDLERIRNAESSAANQPLPAVEPGQSDDEYLPPPPLNP